MDVGVGETKPVAKVMEGSSQVAQAPNQTRPPKDDESDISGVAINKCGFGNGLKGFKTNTFLMDSVCS